MTKLLRGFWKRCRNAKRKDKQTGKLSIKEQLKQKIASEVANGPLIRASRSKVRIQVGIDFGTSATKVAFSPYQRRRTQIISFNHRLPFYPKYCLPSVAAKGQKNRFVIGEEAAGFLMGKPWDLGFRRFKIIVAGNVDEKYRDPLTEENFDNYRQECGYAETMTAERVSAIYLAHVMYQANKAISTSLDYRNSALEFDFNICMPIDHIENSAVKAAFEHIFKWAETIYKIWLVREESTDPIKASYEFEDFSTTSEESRVFAVPEAVAEVASYIVSLRRKEGIHAILDFGAGTTDISVFNYMNPFGESKSTWYSARNIPQGTIEIERLLASRADEPIQPKAPRCSDIYDRLAGLKEYCKEHNNSPLATSIWDTLTALSKSEAYLSAWRTAYKHMKKQSAWDKENIQIFIMGGGINLPYIVPIYSEPWWHNLNGPYKVEVLPPPDDFVPGVASAPFERVAVAYGLSIPLPALDEFVLPSRAPDHTPPELPILRLDRDEIYAK